MQRFSRLLCGLLALFFSGGVLLADDWPQWLGPNRDAVWRETGILERFPTNGPPVCWRTKVGPGYSGPAVADGRVYLTDRRLPREAVKDSNNGEQASIQPGERVLCFNEPDGNLLWQHEYDCRYAISYPAGPRVMPLVAQGRVYTLGAEGNLLCLNATNGQVLWSRDFKQEFGIKAPLWGFAGHPLLEGNKLICIAGGNGTTVVAFDRETGEILWRALSAAEPGYSSPMVYDVGGRRQLILWHPEGASSLNPETGAVYWSVPFVSGSGLSVATPRVEKDLLFVTSFYNGAMALRLDTTKPAATPLWRTIGGNEQKTTHLNAIICTPFMEEGYVYGVCSYGQLRCLKADTGARVWETLQATTSGQPVRWANAFIVKNGARFFLYNEHGDLLIARLSPKGYEELSRAHVLEPVNKDPGRPVVWSHPAFANRKFYARNDKELICLNLAAEP